MLNITNSPAFGAKLDLTQVKGHNEKWHRVANEFEKMTKNGRESYTLKVKTWGPKYDLFMGEGFISIEGRMPDRTESNSELIAKIESDYANKLLQMSPQKMAKKLKVIFDIAGYKDKVFDTLDKTTRKLFKPLDFAGETPCDSIDNTLICDFEKAYDDMINEVLKRWIKKDSDLLSKSNVQIGWF